MRPLPADARREAGTTSEKERDDPDDEEHTEHERKNAEEHISAGLLFRLRGIAGHKTSSVPESTSG